MATTLLVLAAAGTARPGSAASPWSEHEVVAARLIAARPAAGDAAESELRLGLHLRLADGWHVYWKHPGDAGLPPEVTLAADQPLGAPRVLFPAPRRYELRGGLIANGYDGEVVYPLRVPLAAGGRAPSRVTAVVDYLACEDECIPFHDELALDVRAAGPDEEMLLARWEARVPVPLAERPGLAASAAYRGSRNGGDLVLALAGARARDVFVAPVEGTVVGNPRWQGERGAGEARAIVSLAPRTTGAMPDRLRVSWVATGIAGAGAGEAVEAVAEVATDPGSAAVAEGARATPAGGGAALSPPLGEGVGAREEGGAHGPLALLLRGAALALTPGALALLLLAAAAGGAPGGRAWLPPLAGGLGLAALLAAAGIAGRTSGIALPLAEPLALAALALPHLALALALWWGAGRRGDPGAPAPWRSALAAGLLALPFAPALAGAAPALGPGELAALAAGFALPWATAALRAARAGASRRPAAGEGAPAMLPLLGFLPAASLAWISYRLALALPTARLGTMQLAWLGAALAAYLARTARPAARPAWWAAALAAGAASLWLAR